MKNIQKIAKYIKRSFFHPNDDLLAGITFNDLMTAVSSNEKDINPSTVEKTYRNIIKDNTKDAESLLRGDMKQIIEQINKHYK